MMNSIHSKATIFPGMQGNKPGLLGALFLIQSTHKPIIEASETFQTNPRQPVKALNKARLNKV